MKTDRTAGFTLIELMVALAVLAVLLMVAAPAFVNMIKNNRLLSEAYAFRAAINDARSEALSRRVFVTFCRSSNGTSCSGNWTDGYIAFSDDDGDANVDAGDNDEVFLSKVIDADDLTIAYSNLANRVRFDSQGSARAFNGTFRICDDRGAPEARGVIVTNVGIVRAAVDGTSNGIVEDHTGADLVCP